MTKPTLQVLIDARKLIERPENWWDGKRGSPAGPRDCASTAMRGDGDPRHGEYEAHRRFCIANDLDRDFPYSSTMAFNDTHTHAEVLAAFDRTIEAERAKIGATS